MILNRIKKRDTINRKSGENYNSRDVTLKEMGFATYKDYLKSDLWKRIRRKVLKRDKETCEICHCKGNQVHHSRYHKNDLTGKNLNFLHTICGDCHEKIEFKNGEKVQMDEMLERQKSAKAIEDYKRRIEEEYQSKFGFLDSELDEMFRRF